MQTRPLPATHLALAAALFAAASTCGLPTASAQTAPSADASLTLKLIQLLIEKGVLSKDQAGALLTQAQAEAKAAARKPARVNTTAPATAPAAAAPAAAEPPPPPPGTVRVTYVPQIVRDQIAAEVRTQVMEQAKTEGWAAPNEVPEWTKRFRFYGDLRLRAEDNLFSKSNFNQFPDFNAINQSPNGFDVGTPGGPPPPLLNTTEDRPRARMRLHLGVETNIDDWVSTDIRLATGNDTNPVSGDQTLGQNGNFPKYNIWVDRAYIELRPVQSLKAYFGREPNPFWSSILLFDPSLNFDGASAQGSYPITSNLDLFGSGGAFSVFNTTFNFGTTDTVKQPSSNKYLFAGQVGADWKITDDYKMRLATALYSYDNIQGQISQPCYYPYLDCSTDLSRPQFLQFGNTLFPIRNLVPTTLTQAQPQYYGLASGFNVLDVHGQFTASNFAPALISLEGDFAKNLAYNSNSITDRPAGFGPVNNLSGPAGKQVYQGGDTGYLIRLTVGNPEITKLWDWNASVAYKYVESDAVLDAFTDSIFHEGGTNAKGYILEGNLGIARNTWVAARLWSSNQVSGPAYSNQIIQLDLGTRF